MATSKLPPWRYSNAKVLLIEDILAGRCDDLGPEQVYMMRRAFQKYPFKNFKTNLNNLQQAIERDEGRADRDALAVAYDRQLHPPPAVTQPHNYPRWDGSEAQRLLKLDIAAEAHTQMTPEQLYFDKPAYREFPLEVFRKHLYQGRVTVLGRSYWMAFNKTKKKKKNQWM